MNISALLAPGIPEKCLEPFRDTNIAFQIGFPQQTKPEAALIFGGDGTVHRYLPQLYANKTPMLVVPKGSGNDFARALGITSEKVALRAWNEFCATGKNVRQIDLGLIRNNQEETPFCCVVGAGLDGEANARANRMPRWLRGSAGYLLAAMQALVSFRPVEIQVTADARQEKRLALLIAVGNAHRYGGGVKIAPRASLEDGLLDICLVGQISKLKVLFCLPIIYFGGHTRLKEVEYFQARRVRIESNPVLDLYADGELVCRTPVDISLQPKSLPVIVPPEGCYTL
jgi:diacylglycerol kinase (ATP)